MFVETHLAWPLAAAELKPALELVLSLARADMTVLLLHDDAAGALFPALGQGIDDATCALVGSHRPGADTIGMALSERRRIVVRDAWRKEESLSQLAHTIGFRAIEVVPLIGLERQPLGVLAMMFRNSHTCRRRSARRIEQCASMLGVAVQHARRRAEAERAKELAEQAGRTKVQFFARMSHELRTPLQSIAGYVELLRAGAVEPLTPALARVLARVHDSEEVLVHVIDDLITFSRLESGHVTYRIGTVAAEEALRICQSVIGPLAVDHGVNFEVADCPGMFVAADGDKLKQILVNLAANATKVSPRGGTVRLACVVEADMVRFDVSDEGPGIPPDKLREIFEPYVQLGSGDRLGGTGLGLTISRDFAAGMRGQLTVESSLGHGAVFSLRLPRAAHETIRPSPDVVRAASPTL
jgi:signal transduction histidine kinase